MQPLQWSNFTQQAWLYHTTKISIRLSIDFCLLPLKNSKCRRTSVSFKSSRKQMKPLQLKNLLKVDNCLILWYLSSTNDPSICTVYWLIGLGFNYSLWNWNDFETHHPKPKSKQNHSSLWSLPHLSRYGLIYYYYLIIL